MPATDTTAPAGRTETTKLRPYTTEQYIRLVEGIDDEILQRYMQVELQFLADTPGAGDRTFVDLGAGYGRVIPQIAPLARNTICVELNDKMIDELRRRADAAPRVSLITGRMQELPSLVHDTDVVHPVLMILQNTLGTIEGSRPGVLSAMRTVAARDQGTVVLSLFRAAALETWGVSMYALISEMVGRPDEAATDFDNGLFVSTTGYTSKWWTDEEVDGFIEYFGGAVRREVREPEFVIMELGTGR